MTVKRTLLLALFAALAACEPPPSNRAESAEAPEAGAPAASEPAASERPAPQQQEPFPWTGRFAASRELCNGGVWNIGAERIATQGETSCEVQRIERSSNRVVLHNACVAEGMDSEERWTIAKGSGDGITVERDMGPDIYTVDLIRCD